MADLEVAPGELRRAAAAHRDIADELAAASRVHAAVAATFDALGPVFADFREAGVALLEQRDGCYRKHAAVQDDLSGKLASAALEWENRDDDAAVRLSCLGDRP